MLRMKWASRILMLALATSCYGGYISSEEQDGAGNKEVTCPCGWDNRARVVGGKEAKKNEFPLILAVIDLEQDKQFCGASILTPTVALTAAHCTEPKKGDSLGVIAGEHDLYDQEETNSTELYNVKRTIEHEKYNPITFEYDIALLVIETAIKFGQDVGPVCLPSSPIKDLVGKFIKLIGWGKTHDIGDSSDVLMKVNLQVVPLQKCKDSYKASIDLNDPRQICTFRKDKDSCQGDSGGPLIWKDPDTNKWTQVALVSFGKDCASHVHPAVNSDVAYYLPWILEKIKEIGGEPACMKKE